MNYVCPVCGYEIVERNGEYRCSNAKNHILHDKIIETKPTNRIDFKKVAITYSTETSKIYIYECGDDVVHKTDIKDVKDYTVMLHEEVIYKNTFNPTAMIVGGMLFGGLGALAGTQISGSKTKSKSQNVYTISIALNNLNYPGITFQSKDADAVYKITKAFDLLYEKYFKNSEKVEKTDTVSVSTNVIEQKDIPDLLRKYKGLYDDGIITEEEYARIKAKLLS